MLHVFLDWQKISKSILEKVFSLFFTFLSFLVFESKNMKNGPSDRLNFFPEPSHIGYQKTRIMLIFKKANLS